jgi:galactoside O-acetyltransferase
MLKHLKKLTEALIRNIGGAVGVRIRYLYYKKQFKTCGSKVIIEEGVYFENLKSISLGNNIWIDKQTILLGGPFNPNSRNYYQKGSVIVNWGDLVVSDGVHIAPFSLVQAHGGVHIGKNVTIASGSKIYSLSHHYKNLNNPNDPKRYSFSTMAKAEDQFLIIGNVIIEDDAAVGLNSVILPGTHIPRGTWIAAMSTISSKTQLIPNSVYKSKSYS